MLNKHILGIIILALVFGACFLLLETYSLISINSMQGLVAGMILGFVVATITPGVFSTLQTISTEETTSEDSKTLYVGNLPFRTTRYELRELFQPYGKIHSARIVIDRATRKPRGYGFVEMDEKGAVKAMNSLNGHSLAGRNLKVSEANERG